MKIYMGYDIREATSYAVARGSILSTATEPVDIEPLDRFHPIMLDRPVEFRDKRLWCPISRAPMSTDFAVARFAVPFICDEDWALFVDCDILVTRNIRDLFMRRDERYAVQVVKHEYTPREQWKMDEQMQSIYPRKNWSSVMLWNLKHEAHKRLDRTALMSWPGRDLHAFKWLKDEEIGALPEDWNYLVGVYPQVKANNIPALLHYTLGGPYFNSFLDPIADRLWQEEHNGTLPEVSEGRRTVG